MHCNVGIIDENTNDHAKKKSEQKKTIVESIVVYTMMPGVDCQTEQTYLTPDVGGTSMASLWPYPYHTLWQGAISADHHGCGKTQNKLWCMLSFI